MHVQQAKNRQAHSQLQRLCVLKPGEFKRPCPCDKTALPEPPTHRENVSSTSKPQISWLFKANRTASHQAHVCEFLLEQWLINSAAAGDPIRFTTASSRMPGTSHEATHFIKSSRQGLPLPYQRLVPKHKSGSKRNFRDHLTKANLASA